MLIQPRVSIKYSPGYCSPLFEWNICYTVRHTRLLYVLCCVLREILYWMRIKTWA